MANTGGNILGQKRACTLRSQIGRERKETKVSGWINFRMPNALAIYAQ